MKMTTKIMKYNCSHKFQDERYGKGNCVHNDAPKSGPGGKSGWRCTVCNVVESRRTNE